MVKIIAGRYHSLLGLLQRQSNSMSTPGNLYYVVEIPDIGDKIIAGYEISYPSADEVSAFWLYLDPPSDAFNNEVVSR